MTWSRRFRAGASSPARTMSAFFRWGTRTRVGCGTDTGIRNRLPVRRDEGARVQGGRPRNGPRRSLLPAPPSHPGTRMLERWSAHDTTLARTIVLTIVDAEHPNRAGVLDAARRAAGVEDARLVRILDVGSQDGNSYFAEEGMDGVLSLTSLLTRGPLPPPKRPVACRGRGRERARHRACQRPAPSTPSLPSGPTHPDGGCAIQIGRVAIATAIDDVRGRTRRRGVAAGRDRCCHAHNPTHRPDPCWPLMTPGHRHRAGAAVVHGGVPAPSRSLPACRGPGVPWAV